MPGVLVTGTPGAGKTLYTCAVLLREFLAEVLQFEDGRELPRRLCVNGIRDLTIDHVPIDAPTVVDWDSYDDKWTKQLLDRDPGMPALDVPHRVDNWWLWCMPGDVIVVDECQRIFKPMASGRKIPGFISKIETHRHYGIDFVFVTQSPMLVHRHIRDLCGRWLHVRSWWMGKCLVYEFDKVGTGASLTGAVKTKVWTKDKKAYSVYKSAEIHTKRRFGIPLYVWMMLTALVLAPVAIWDYVSRLSAHTQKPGQVAQQQKGQGGAAVAAPPAAAAASSVPAQFLASIPAQHYAPPEVLGCWLDHGTGQCSCVLRDRRIVEREAMCASVVRGDLLLQASMHPPAPVPPAPAPAASGVLAYGSPI